MRGDNGRERERETGSAEKNVRTSRERERDRARDIKVSCKAACLSSWTFLERNNK